MCQFCLLCFLHTHCSTSTVPIFLQCTDGDDFKFTPRTFTFDEAISVQCHSVDLVDDSIEEPDEYVNFCLDIETTTVLTVFGPYNMSTVTISDNDG